MRIPVISVKFKQDTYILIDYNSQFDPQHQITQFGPIGGSEISEFVIHSGNFQWNSSNLKVPVNYWNTTEFFNLLKFYGILVIPTENSQPS